MEITTTTTDKTPRRQAALSALAIVGFIVLILIGIGLAIYAARFVPVALNRLGTGAVSFSSVFTPAEEAPEPEAVVVVTETSVPFEPVATSTETSVVTVTPTYTAAPAATTRTVTYTQPSTVTVPVTVPPQAPYGRADLTVEITAVGYCTSDRVSSFRRGNEVPDGENGGIQFQVRNAGTNTSGQWDFEYDLPTSPALSRTVSNQRSLGAGDRVDYTLCFTEPRSGNNRTARITVDSGRDVGESNENNNSDSAQVDIES
ncbi:MAG: hypothetical protein QOE22_608 [Candidatus Parcubacteria bacterium]|jgi:hypothetical protein|nr:hypothetical protein [Candidatus Parcubacteria bacterium]